MQGMNKANFSLEAGASIGQALTQVSGVLEASGVYFGHGTDNPWDEAVQLVLAAADIPLDSNDNVLPTVLTPMAIENIESLLSRRTEENIPLPYLLGTAWFAGLQFRCDQRAIIPRSPIAELIGHDFAPWYNGPPVQRVLDLCCGGGCIGLSIAHYFPDAQVELLDLDAEALSLAAENAALLGVADRVTIRQSDVFSVLARGSMFDLIVSNPPYVDAADLASMPAEYQHEPALALGSGDDGLDITHRILADCGQYLNPTGQLIVEVGNSGPALEAAYASVPFTWIEFEHGGEGVFTLSAQEWQDYSASWRR